MTDTHTLLSHQTSDVAYNSMYCHVKLCFRSHDHNVNGLNMHNILNNF